MQPHQQRVVDERTELETKHTALKSFIDTNEAFTKLPVAEQARMHLQYAIMRDYINVLSDRIKYFESLPAEVTVPKTKVEVKND